MKPWSLISGALLAVCLVLCLEAALAERLGEVAAWLCAIGGWMNANAQYRERNL